MAQNNNMQYVFTQNPGVLAPGQTDQFPPSSLQGAIAMHRANPGGRAISAHKLNLGFTDEPNQRLLYTVWRNCAKDQMIARNFAPVQRKAANFPDADFLPIYTGMRTLRPACDYIVSAVAANNLQRIVDIEEAVVELVKDSCRKLNDTNNKGRMIVPNPAIPPAQVVVHASLLPPGAPNQWGAATTIHNPGQLPQNIPAANLPAGQPLAQALPAGNPALGQNVPAAQQVVPALPPGNPAADPNVPAAQQVYHQPAGNPALGQIVPAAQQLYHQLPPGNPALGNPALGGWDPNVPAAQQLYHQPAGNPALGQIVPAAQQLYHQPAGNPALGQIVPAAQQVFRHYLLVILRRIRMYLLRNSSIINRPVILRWVKSYLLRNKWFRHYLLGILRRIQMYLLRNSSIINRPVILRWVKTYLFSLVMTQNTHK
jgi:hypothetical protein